MISNISFWYAFLVLTCCATNFVNVEKKCNISGYSMPGQDESTLSVVTLLVNVLSINLADVVVTPFGLLIRGCCFK